jgi:hypothetical protein
MFGNATNNGLTFDKPSININDNKISTDAAPAASIPSSNNLFPIFNKP